MMYLFQRVSYVLVVLWTLTHSLACRNSNNKPENAETDNSTITQETAPTTVQPLPVPPIYEDTLIVNLRTQVLTSLKNKDMKTFATFIHPTLGIRFSPYAFIDTTSDRTFTKDSFIKQINSKKKLNWGAYDAGEENINMTLDEYFATFVYNADYLNAKHQSVNRIIFSGNTINNLQEVYENCSFTESYFSGLKKKFEGMDWCSLRLVFKKHLDRYYLIGIIHDQWTS